MAVSNKYIFSPCQFWLPYYIIHPWFFSALCYILPGLLPAPWRFPPLWMYCGLCWITHSVLFSRQPLEPFCAHGNICWIHTILHELPKYMMRKILIIICSLLVQWSYIHVNYTLGMKHRVFGPLIWTKACTCFYHIQISIIILSLLITPLIYYTCLKHLCILNLEYMYIGVQYMY